MTPPIIHETDPTNFVWLCVEVVHTKYSFLCELLIFFILLKMCCKCYVDVQKKKKLLLIVD